MGGKAHFHEGFKKLTVLHSGKPCCNRRKWLGLLLVFQNIQSLDQIKIALSVS